MEEQCTYSNIQITPAELTFEFEEGSGSIPHSQWLKITKVSPGLMPNWGVASSSPWLKLRIDTQEESYGTVNVEAKCLGMSAGTYDASIVFTASPSVNTPLNFPVKLIVTPKPVPLKIINPVLCDGVRGDPYTCSIIAEGGKQPYNWTCSGLPDGLTFDNQAAEITGIPAISGTFSFQVTVSDSISNVDKKEYTINITEPPKPPVKVAIVSPAGREVWYKGDIHYIKWVAENEEDETLDIVILYDNSQDSVAPNVPIGCLEFSWLIESAANENNIIKLWLPDGSSVQSGSFAIRERSGCSPFGLLLKISSFVRRK